MVRCLVVFVIFASIVGTMQQEIDIRSMNNVVNSILRNQNPLIAALRTGAFLKGLYKEYDVAGNLLSDVKAVKKSLLNILQTEVDDDPLDTVIRIILGTETKPEMAETSSAVEVVPKNADVTEFQ